MQPLVLLASVALTFLCAADAGAVTVRAVADDFDFSGDTRFEVEFTVDDAVDLTGLQFSVVYPSDLLAVEAPSTHVVGPLFSHSFVNHEADSSDLPAGFQRIGVAFSVAQPVSLESGSLLTVSFPIRCNDFSGGWPEGRPVTVSIEDAAAWKAAGSGIPAPVSVDADDVTITADCNSVPLAGVGFSTLKARHRDRGGEQ